MGQRAATDAVQSTVAAGAAGYAIGLGIATARGTANGARFGVPSAIIGGQLVWLLAFMMPLKTAQITIIRIVEFQTNLDEFNFIKASGGKCYEKQTFDIS